jgi:glutamate-1-semialdehyde aminotransferase
MVVTDKATALEKRAQRLLERELDRFEREHPRSRELTRKAHGSLCGLLLTPFHNMALMSPATSEADVDRHTEIFAEAAKELTAGD